MDFPLLYTVSVPSGPESAISVAIPRTVLRVAGYVGAAVVAGIVVILVVIAISSRLSSNDPLASAINTREYQAVFLTNSEIYFGRLTATGGDFYYLRHVYRLTAQPSKRGQQLTRTLVRITNDVHSPDDLMVINRKQILYVENLSPTGKAAQLMNGQ